MPHADLAAQRALIDLADVDRAHDAAVARRDGLPEHGTIAAAESNRDTLLAQVIVAQATVDDLASAMRKLDLEMQQVRSRTQRDEDLLASGTTPAKELENIQRELESLARRQNTLDDEALELMQQQEDAENELGRLRSAVTVEEDAIGTAVATRDSSLEDIAGQLADLASDRDGLIERIPQPVLAIYDRLRGRGQIGAATISGATCGACQMILDRSSVDEILATPADQVPSCSECGALLVRS